MQLRFRENAYDFMSEKVDSRWIKLGEQVRIERGWKGKG